VAAAVQLPQLVLDVGAAIDDGWTCSVWRPKWMSGVGGPARPYLVGGCQGHQQAKSSKSTKKMYKLSMFEACNSTARCTGGRPHSSLLLTARPQQGPQGGGPALAGLPRVHCRLQHSICSRWPRTGLTSVRLGGA
jgi:hypothetical protein